MQFAISPATRVHRAASACAPRAAAPLIAPPCRSILPRAALTDAPQADTSQADTSTTISSNPTLPPLTDHNQVVREGHYEATLVERQAEKLDPEQPSIASILPRFDPSAGSVEMIVVGCGPAGLALAAEVASHGVSVALLGHDAPFVNNYGVWVDEFAALGLQDTLDRVWDDAACWFGEGKEVRVGRPYGRVCRRRLRSALLERCRTAGVSFLPCQVVDIQQHDATHMHLTCLEPTHPTAHTTTTNNNNTHNHMHNDTPSSTSSTSADMKSTTSSTSNTSTSIANASNTSAAAIVQHTAACRLVTLASGAAAGRFLKYEGDAPAVAAQTAYGIEAVVDGYDEAYNGNIMLFMDFRRHHSGVWQGAGPKLRPGLHPNAGEGMWGTSGEVPSFLYAMPLGNGRVFLEETCLVAKPALPFSVLKRRLQRRLEAMGVKVKAIEEEEWSYIPVGGPLPLGTQPITAFGAAANLVHPATGYSIARSLREAPVLGEQVARIVRQGLGVEETAKGVWEALWSAETRRQAAFHVFGMELLCQLDLAATNNFFITFFRLPPAYWRGFLASSLSSTQLLVFAMLTFVLAPPSIQAKLVGHLLTHPAGRYLVSRYTGSVQTGEREEGAGGQVHAGALAALVLAVAAAAGGTGGEGDVSMWG